MRGRLSRELALGVAALATAGGPFGAQAARAAELKIVDPLAVIYDIEDGEKTPAREVIRLVAPRNAVCSAAVLALGDDASGVRAALDVLRSPGGAMPPDMMTVRYADNPGMDKKIEYFAGMKGHPVKHFAAAYNNPSYYDILRAEPAAGADVVPIWVTVSVPANAGPGRYTGTLRTGDVELPVELTVCDWLCPGPRDFAIYTNMLQSPETVAAYYDVPLWSDEHFALVAESLKFMGLLGNKSLFVTGLHETHLGNTAAMVRFRKAGDGYAPDFGVMNRYFDLYQQHVGTPHDLVLYVWDGGRERRQQGRRRRQGATVELTQMVDGQAVPLEAPYYGAPGSEEFWRPLLEAFRAAVRERGWPADRIHVGFASDGRPDAATVEFFRNVAPWADWAIFTHGRGAEKSKDGKVTMDGFDVGHYEVPWLPSIYYKNSIQVGVLGGWDEDFVMLSSGREYMSEYVPPSQWRRLAEGVVGSTSAPESWLPYGHNVSSRGLCRIGLDYWEVDGSRLCFRVDSHWRGLYRSFAPKALLAAGPKGAIGTVRFEMLREGIQECEARIFIEKALAAGRVGGDLADRCVVLLKDRLRMRWKDGGFGRGPDYKGPDAAREVQTRLWGIGQDWQAEAERLFNMAAEVQKAVQAE